MDAAWVSIRPRLGSHGWLARFLASLLVLLTACTIPISYHDATTYTQLTSLKAESMTLVETFDKVPCAQNEAKIDATTLTFRKALEYERGKGEPNDDTAAQFEIIFDLFLKDVEEYRREGPASAALGRLYFQESARILGQAFDKAIQTENLKNKDKR